MLKWLSHALLAMLLPLGSGIEEWHAAREVVMSNERGTNEMPITTAVLDTSSQTVWGLQTQCEGAPSEPSVLKMEVNGAQQYTLSHVKPWSLSWPKLYHCSNWQFQSHFDQVTKNLVFFGGISDSETGTSDYADEFRIKIKFSNELWGLDTGHSNWTRIPGVGTAPPGRALHGAAWDQQGRRLWIFGGLGGDGDFDASADVTDWSVAVVALWDLWQGKFNSNNSVSWTKLGTHPYLDEEDTVLRGQEAFFGLVWEPQREALWTMFRRNDLELWCYLTKQQTWRKFETAVSLSKSLPPAALVYHGNAKEIFLLNGTNSWIFSTSTGSFRAPTVIAAMDNLPSSLGSGRYVWNEAAQEALFLSTDSGRTGEADIYKLRLHPSCEQIFCPRGYLEVSGSQGHSVADCCGMPCSNFSCPVGYEHVSESARVAGQTKERCCRGEGATQEDEDHQSGREPDQTFLWLAVAIMALCIPVVCLNFYLIRSPKGSKFKCSFKRRTPAQQDAAMDSSA